MTPQLMVEQVKTVVAGWPYDVVSIGYPGPVVRGQPGAEPRNLGTGWVGFDFQEAFGRPVKVLNDAAMQALGSYEGGRMLFLGLGTGLGSALVIACGGYPGSETHASLAQPGWILVPLELAHLPYRKKQTFEDFLGRRGLDRLGKSKWQACVEDVVTRLKAAVVADYVVLGGGNIKHLKRLPPSARLGSNLHAFEGGFRLWTSVASDSV
jgi:polyphosphate glucokinase